eukprot:CAMPEP_0184692256 /NCGR_PEP_ID=MMETSP0313-20130426/817_1 /TAXON_ID=2792 /ORGANISM="Porphyridium aerugineum, Strain SAG 1380-2" /LENGTH=604 /DNA_ID=CAMNT_0027150077 /DNA_START=63 /DNA_END=1877 /DNA_ORIENTATION=-
MDFTPAEASAEINGSETTPSYVQQSVEVKDPYLYNLLGVPVGTSSESVFRKAYYVKARDCHPDKNIHDAKATETFQMLAEAYQILNNDDTREHYNKVGYEAFKKGQTSGEMMDASVLFTMLFGNERFNDYVGTLRLASFAKMAEEREKEKGKNNDKEREKEKNKEKDKEGSAKPVDSTNALSSTSGHDLSEHEPLQSEEQQDGEDGEQGTNEQELFNEEEMDKIEQKRISDLTATMASRLNLCQQGKFEEFRSWAQTEAESLLETTFGGPMLVVLGTMYVERAKIFLGNQTMLGFGGWVSSLKHSSHMFGAQLRTTVSAVKAMERQKAIAQYMEREENQPDQESHSEDAANKIAAKTVVDVLELMWNVTCLDIQVTADQVAKQVLEGKDLGEKSEKDRREEAPVSDFLSQSFRELRTSVDPSQNNNPSQTNQATALRAEHHVPASSGAGKGQGNQGNQGSQGSQGYFGWSQLWGAIQTSWHGRDLPKEGSQSIERLDILNARAIGLKILGEIFVSIGSKVDATEELLKALGIDKKEAEEMEKMVEKIQEDERRRQKEDKAAARLAAKNGPMSPTSPNRRVNNSASPQPATDTTQGARSTGSGAS